MAYDPQNVFAKILRSELPCIKLYEDADTFAMMDIMPQSDGHLLVLTREPAETVFDMSEAALQRCILITRKLAAAAVSALGADGALISQFNGAAAGQTVPHVHFHVIPRFAGVAMKSHGREREDMARLEEIARRIIAALPSAQ
ncbi:MAG: HIT family protein [Rhodocyclaceae bacterium]|nr:HIT family protein [Rhodocyclaceae bacterium]MCP5241678.1 HIT family protein [Zoogloeaceae bacterium]MCB1913497.1 HIT family protein [Rhodocyclaceae bacterium]MCP5255033.1 HIT family protein [Zoogloeaceae bacterium]MCP5295490.1 HIT family protein [Zoogloeaceae bacterium]